MLVIGENINILNPAIYEAVMQDDIDAVVDMALRQVRAGAMAVEVNVGPGRQTGEKLPEIVRRVADAMGDSAKIFISADLGFIIDSLKDTDLKDRGVINAATADREILRKYLATARSLECGLVVMLIRSGLLPGDAETTCLIAEDVVEEAERSGFPLEKLYLDPVLRSSYDPTAPAFASVAGLDHVLEALILIGNLRAIPVRTVAGLSNISLGQPYSKRSEYHCSVLPLLVQAGLSAAIMNVFDRRLMKKIEDVHNEDIVFSMLDKYRQLQTVLNIA